jgi:hypothetical protein
VTPSGDEVPIKVRSMVGMIPLLAAAVVSESDLRRALVLGKQFADLLGRENLVDVSALERYHRFLGDDFTIEYPTGSGTRLTLDKVADDLQDRLISIFTRGPDGRRPCLGGNEVLQADAAWRDNVVFGEYFHGDNAAALGASHQIGWTGLIADIIRRRYGLVRSIGDVVLLVGQDHRA